MSHLAASIEGFQTSYCAARNLDRHDFVIDVLGKCVHQPWRWLWPVIRHNALTWFYRDYELVLAVSRLHDLRDFNAELSEFDQLQMNRHGLRGKLRRRIATERLRAEFLDTMERESGRHSHATGKSELFPLDRVTCP